VYTYKAYGLTIESEIAIPEFLPVKGEDPVDLFIKSEKIFLSPFLTRFRDRVIKRGKLGTILYWKKKAAFLLKDNTLLVDPHPDSRETNMVNALLIGPVMGNVAMERGDCSVFHSAVMADPTGTGAVAVMAVSGQGKSTTASAMLERGFSLVSDDLLILDKKDYSTAYPGYPGMKLWGETVRRFVSEEEELPYLGKRGVYDKRFRPLADSFHRTPIPIKAVFLLQFDDELTQPQTIRLSEKEALLKLQPHWYGSLFSGELLPLFGKRRLFEECAALAKNIPLYELSRPFDMGRLDESVELIQSLI